MAFLISSQNGELLLQGNLNVDQVHQIRPHLINFKKERQLIINLSALDSLDTGSVFELKHLSLWVRKYQKMLTFTGESNQKIKGAFKRSGIALF